MSTTQTNTEWDITPVTGENRYLIDLHLVTSGDTTSVGWSGSRSGGRKSRSFDEMRNDGESR